MGWLLKLVSLVWLNFLKLLNAEDHSGSSSSQQYWVLLFTILLGTFFKFTLTPFSSHLWSTTLSFAQSF